MAEDIQFRPMEMGKIGIRYLFAQRTTFCTSSVLPGYTSAEATSSSSSRMVIMSWVFGSDGHIRSAHNQCFDSSIVNNVTHAPYTLATVSLIV